MLFLVVGGGFSGAIYEKKANRFAFFCFVNYFQVIISVTVRKINNFSVVK